MDVRAAPPQGENRSARPSVLHFYLSLRATLSRESLYTKRAYIIRAFSSLLAARTAIYCMHVVRPLARSSYYYV